MLNKLNSKCNKTRHGNIKMIAVKVLVALRQLKNTAAYSMKTSTICLEPKPRHKRWRLQTQQLTSMLICQAFVNIASWVRQLSVKSATIKPSSQPWSLIHHINFLVCYILQKEHFLRRIKHFLNVVNKHCIASNHCIPNTVCVGWCVMFPDRSRIHISSR